MKGEEARRLDRVLAVEDVGQRNFAITRAYYRMARRVDAVVGTQDANWLTFGTWASASAGRFIRRETLPVAWGAEQVAAGNAAIIADIGPRFATFLDLADDLGTGPLAAAVGREPALAGEPELAEAFECYARAGALPAGPGSDADHAELVLRANVLVAHYEQRLADRFVDQALPLGGPFGTAATLFVTVEVPEGQLHVSRDVSPPAYLGGAPWPPPLMRLRDLRLVELARMYGQDQESARFSDATSWEDLYERMGYIFCFFRAYQRDAGLVVLPPGVPPSGPEDDAGS